MNWTFEDVTPTPPPNAAAAAASTHLAETNARAQMDAMGAKDPGILMSDGSYRMPPPGASVVTDANKTNWTFEDTPKPYSERPLGPVENYLAGDNKGAAKEVFGRLNDVAIGANDTLASALSLPGAAVANMVNSIFNQDHKLFQGYMTADEMKQHMVNGLESMGVGADKTKAFNQWWANLGGNTGAQALMSMALIAGAPSLVAGGEALGGTTGAVMKTVGETAVAHPGMVVASDAGAVAGGTALPLAEPYLKALGIDNPNLVNPETLGMLGNLLGGPVGASISTLARIRPTDAVNFFGNPKNAGLPRFGGTLVKDAIPGAKPLLDNGFTPDDISAAVKGTQQEVMSAMQKRIDHITKGNALDPAVEAQQLREANNQAYQQTQGIEKQMWAAVNQNRPVTPTGSKTAVAEVRASASDPSVRAADLPSDIIKDIDGWKGDVTMSRMRDMARLARGEAAGIYQGTDRSLDVRAANLTKIANSIDDDIAKMYPNDINLAKAKAFTQWQHDMFSGSSPLASLSAVRANQARMAVDAPTAVKSAMRDSRLPGQIADVAQTANMAPELQGRTEDYLRSMVGDAYRTGGPNIGIDPLKEELAKTAAAKAYMESPDFKRFAKAFPAMDNVFQRQTNQLVNAVGKAAEIARSKFFNLAADQPEKAVDHLFASGTKVNDSRLIMKNIGKDPKAVDALEYALIRKLGNDVNWDPTNMVARLNSRDLRKTMVNIMGPDKFGRMERILQTGAKLQSGEANGLIGMSPTKTAGRILGSLFTGAAGGKSIQVHSIGTKIGGNIMQRIFHTVPPEYFIQKALVDPNWERFLMSKLPENMEGFRTTTRLIGLLAGGLEAGHRKISDMGNEQQ